MFWLQDHYYLFWWTKSNPRGPSSGTFFLTSNSSYVSFVTLHPVSVFGRLFLTVTPDDLKLRLLPWDPWSYLVHKVSVRVGSPLTPLHKYVVKDSQYAIYDKDLQWLKVMKVGYGVLFHESHYSFTSVRFCISST